MVLNGRLVQVARPTPDNSLVQGVVGVARLVWPTTIVGYSDLYLLEPESPDDQEKVEGLLFAEGELEELPFDDQYAIMP